MPAGTVVASGSLVSPGGQQGISGQNMVWQGFVSKTAAYTLVPADSAKYIICSGGSWTLTLPAPALGLIFQIRNDMGIVAGSTTGTITLQSNGGTIDGQASIALLPQQECTLITDGTNWRTLGKQRSVVLGTLDITVSTATAVVLLPVGYRDFEIVLKDYVPVTNRDFLQALFSMDGGSTWKNTLYYEGIIYDNAATTVAYQSNQSTAYATVSSTGNTGGPYGSFTSMKLTPGTASLNPSYIIYSEGYDSTAIRLRQYITAGMWAGAGPVNALRFNGSTSNIANLSITVKGFV